MTRIIALAVFSTLFAVTLSSGQASSAQKTPPLRVGIVGLVHGHVHGFLDQSLHSPEIQIVGVAEPDARLLSLAATRYSFDRSLLFADLEEMLQKSRPQPVLVYTTTSDHRPGGGACARPAVPVTLQNR